MRNPVAALLRSAVEWFEKEFPMRSEHAPSRQELREMILGILSEPATAREAAARSARAFGVEGGAPLTVAPGNAGDIVKYASAPDNLGPATNFVESGGKIGIGTTNPQKVLQVDSSTGDVLRLNRAGTGAVDFQVSAAMTGSTMDLVIDPAQASSGFLFRPRDSANSIVNGLGIDRNGNVGIGTLVPSFALALNRATPTDTVLEYQSSAALKALLGVAGAGNNLIAGTAAGDFAFRTQNQKILFSANAGANAHVVLDTSGNVGIGTASPSNKLHVEGGNVQIGSPTGVSTGWRTLLLGTSGPKQVNLGPEMITAAALNDDPDPDKHNRRVVLWSGVEGDTEAMFLINSNGILEWGAGGNNDQDIFLSRTGSNQLTLTDTFAVSETGDAQPRIALKHNSANGGEIQLGNGSAIPDVNLYRNAANQLRTDDAFLVPSGSASAPSLTFGTDPNTGIYNPLADELGVVTGGSERVRINSTGKMGVGITSPKFILHTSGAAVALGAPASAPTDADLNNSNISFWLDQTNNKLKVRVRYSNGTLRTATIDLAP